jgi:hypothetical protein
MIVGLAPDWRKYGCSFPLIGKPALKSNNFDGLFSRREGKKIFVSFGHGNMYYLHWNKYRHIVCAGPEDLFW